MIGPGLPKSPEVHTAHAPMVKAQGSLLLMIAAAYGAGWRNQNLEAEGDR